MPCFSISACTALMASDTTSSQSSQKDSASCASDDDSRAEESCCVRSGGTGGHFCEQLGVPLRVSDIADLLLREHQGTPKLILVCHKMHVACAAPSTLQRKGQPHLSQACGVLASDHAVMTFKLLL